MSRTILVWVTDSSSRACVRAASTWIGTQDQVTLLYVISSQERNATRDPHRPTKWWRSAGPTHAQQVWNVLYEQTAARRLDEARDALGRHCRTIVRRGRVEREVVTVAAEEKADLLCLARGGALDRLSPKSLGRTERFVVDHAPCDVFVGWPVPTPSLSTLLPIPLQ